MPNSQFSLWDPKIVEMGKKLMDREQFNPKQSKQGEFVLLNKDKILAVTLFLLVLFFYSSILSAWWRMDDTLILKYVLKYNPVEYFFISDVWQQITFQFLTPWLIASFDFDHFVFGLRPMWFYLHQLIILGFLSGTFFMLLRHWLKPLWSFLTCFLFLSGTPIVISAQFLNNRHYLEGLLFITLALYCYVLALKRERMALSWIGSFFYLLSMSCKEIFVPFGAIFFLLPQKRMSKRLPYAMPFLIPAILYIPWRIYMLKDIFKAYGSSIGLADFSHIIHKWFVYLFGSGFQGLSVLVALSIIIVIFFSQFKKYSIFIFVCLICLLMPIIPVFIHITDTARYNILPWCFFSVFIGIVLGKSDLNKNKVNYIKIFLILLLLYPSVSQAWLNTKKVSPIVKRYDAIGKFIWNHNDSEYNLYLPKFSRFHPFYAYGTVWLFNYEKEQNKKIHVFADEKQIEESNISLSNTWYYNPKKYKMELDPEFLQSKLDLWRKKVLNKPLSVKINYKDHFVSWEFGPYDRGAYSLFIIDSLGVTKSFNLPPKGKLRYMFQEKVFQLFFRYKSPEGWITYSPELTFNTANKKPLVWKR